MLLNNLISSYILSILLSILSCIICVQINPQDPVVSTRYGQVRGRLHESGSINGGQGRRQMIQFIGIPYGRAPSGASRFQVPMFPDPWSGEVKDCTNNRVMCPQVEQRFNLNTQSIPREDEDCLHLNVYVPVTTTNVQNLPVMVYIHGGEFLYGGKDFYRPDFIMEQSTLGSDPGVILVTINYRLGVLGFLSTDDIHQPGNNGIRDQTLALRWVAENIGAFNGNPGNVTIFGHDAGAISVSLHILNRESWDYFTNAISIGGTVFTPWAFETEPKQQAINLGNFFRCDLRSDKLVECLRYQDVGALMGKSRDREEGKNYRPYWFRPVVDRNVSNTALLRDYPLALYQTGQFKRAPYIVGITSKEGALEYYLQAERLMNMPTKEDKIAFLVRPFILPYASEDIIATALKYQYFKRNQTRTNPYGSYGMSAAGNRYPTNMGGNAAVNIGGSLNRNYQPFNPQGNAGFQQNPYDSRQIYRSDEEILVEMLGDFLYVAPSDYVLRLHTGGGAPAWQFVFEYEGSLTFGILQREGSKASRTQYGVTHMDDLFFLMPNEYSLDSFGGGGNNIDKVTSNMYTRSLIMFAKFGTVSPGIGGMPFSWPPYTLNQANYVRIIGNGVTQANMLYRSEQSDYFNDFVYELQRKAQIRQYFPYEEYRAFQAGTWSLLGVILLLILILIVLGIIFFYRRRNEKQTMKLLRREDKELEDRGANERL